jgi:hypothetical protein
MSVLTIVYCIALATRNSAAYKKSVIIAIICKKNLTDVKRYTAKAQGLQVILNNEE